MQPAGLASWVLGCDWDYICLCLRVVTTHTRRAANIAVAPESTGGSMAKMQGGTGPDDFPYEAFSSDYADALPVDLLLCWVRSRGVGRWREELPTA